MNRRRRLSESESDSDFMETLPVLALAMMLISFCLFALMAIKLESGQETARPETETAAPAKKEAHSPTGNGDDEIRIFINK